MRDGSTGAAADRGNEGAICALAAGSIVVPIESPSLYIVLPKNASFAAAEADAYEASLPWRVLENLPEATSFFTTLLAKLCECLPSGSAAQSLANAYEASFATQN
jgi:hypothetical protein